MKRIISGRVAGAALLLASPVPAAKAVEPVKITGGPAVKGVGQVVVAAFNVGFLFQSVDNTGGATRSGLLHAFGGATTAKSELQGVTPAMMQAVTDAAYADFVAQLAARGFTVADSAAMFAGAEFQQAKVKYLAAPYETSVQLEKNSKGKTSFYKPAALPGMVMLAGDFTPAQGMLSGFTAMGSAMQSVGTSIGFHNHAKASGQAVLDVVYLIDFSDATRARGLSLAGVKVTSGMSVVGDYSKMSVVAPGGKQASIVLREPLAVQGDFATMADASGGFNKGAETAVNVLGAFAGIGMGKTRKYTFTARPGAYEEGAIKAATLANTRLVEQLAALR